LPVQVWSDRLAVSDLQHPPVQVDVRFDHVDARIEGGMQVGHIVPGPVCHGHQGSMLHARTVWAVGGQKGAGTLPQCDGLASRGDWQVLGATGRSSAPWAASPVTPYPSRTAQPAASASPGTPAVNRSPSRRMPMAPAATGLAMMTTASGAPSPYRYAD